MSDSGVGYTEGYVDGVTDGLRSPNVAALNAAHERGLRHGLLEGDGHATLEALRAIYTMAMERYSHSDLMTHLEQHFGGITCG